MSGGFRENELSKKDERTGEWLGLRWWNVEFFTSASCNPLVQLGATGKTGTRDTVSMRNAEFILRRRQRRLGASRNHRPLFLGVTGRVIEALRRHPDLRGVALV